MLYAVCDMFMYIGVIEFRQYKRLVPNSLSIWNQATIDFALFWYPEK